MAGAVTPEAAGEKTRFGAETICCLETPFSEKRKMAETEENTCEPDRPAGYATVNSNRAGLAGIEVYAKPKDPISPAKGATSGGFAPPFETKVQFAGTDPI
jgi:hypothetical protein